MEIFRLYIKLTSPVPGKGGKFVPVAETPHYQFIKNRIVGSPVQPMHGYMSYSHYNTRNQHHLDEHGFEKLLNSIMTNGYDESEGRPLVIKRRNLSFSPSWNVLDGSHRISILAARGDTHVMVAVVRFRKNIIRRGIERIGSAIKDKRKILLSNYRLTIKNSFEKTSK